MIAKIEKSRAVGRVSAPPSKSMAHRLLIAAAMCEGESRIDGISSCEDVLATIDCLRALGVKIDYIGDSVTVVGIDFKKAVAAGTLPCRESGSTLRFLIPLALLSGERATFSGTKKLISRPQGVYEDICQNQGLIFEKGEDTIIVGGPLCGGEYRVRGDVSSQFITGLLFALSALDKDSRIVITTKIESRPYIELTRSAMSAFGVEVFWENDSTLYIRAGQRYSPKNLSVEGDYSGAAFIEAFNYLGGEVEILGLYDDSLQGDAAYREYFRLLDGGAPEINIEDTPDLAPVLFTLAAIKNGATFLGTRRLEIKESNRALAMKQELSKFGAELVIEENRVVVKKSKLHAPSERLFGHNDHRIVMSLSVIASVFGGEICGALAVAKSYPDFFEEIKKLGILVKTYEAD